MTTILRSLCLAAVAATVAAQAAVAQPKDVSAYIKLAGEVGTARFNCNFEMDSQALTALGRRFAVDPSDAKALDQHAAQIAAELARAQQLYQSQGAEVFCRNALASYGPSGSVVPGLLKPR